MGYHARMRKLGLALSLVIACSRQDELAGPAFWGFLSALP